jgi:hypothetical protein
MSMGSAAAALKLGVDGVRLNGDKGRRRLPLEVAVPGRARPACSFCSTMTVSYTQIESDMMELERRRSILPSVHPNNALINCNASNFFGSLRSILKKCKK